jgi:hypothetical protein
MGALAQSGTHALTMASYASVSTFPGKKWIRVLAMTAMIAYADARALPPYHSAQIGSGSDTAISSNDLGNDSPPEREPGLESHGTNWSLWVTLAIAFISLLGGAEAWSTFRGERVRQIRAMGYVCVFTLAVAATPMVLHEAGGIEAEVKGPLLALWAGGHLNFVLRGAILVTFVVIVNKHSQVSHICCCTWKPRSSARGLYPVNVDPKHDERYSATTLSAWLMLYRATWQLHS